MIRRLVLLCVLLTTMSTVYGLGLGRLEMRSALNQNFEGEIVLTNVGNLTTDEVVSNLATQDDFQRVKIERTALLLDLDFETVQREDGTMVIVVTSSRPIVEPFLNFLVEVLWPNGRVLREYTVLLDPPVFGQEGIAPIEPVRTTPPATTTGSRPTSGFVPGSRDAGRTSRPAPTGNPLQEGTFANGEYGMTGPGDTLWKVALKVRPNRSVTVQQTMLALVQANPDAFINGNVNLLKAGYVLRVPDLGEIRALSASEAVTEVEYHNEAFESYRSGERVAQLDATRRTRPSGASSGVAAGEGELVVSARNDSTVGDISGSGASDGRTAALENELAVTREDLDRARRANAELNTRLDDLSEQMETLNALLSAKNDQLALLQNEVQKMQNAAAAAPAPQPAPSGSLLTNTYVLGGLVLLGVALVAGLLVYMRRRQQDEGDLAQPFAAAQEQETSPSPDQEPSLADTVERSATAAGMASVEEDESVEQETEDPITEADIYIAYGRFPQAITFLQNAIESDPERVDLHMKLLEVYVQTEDATAFNLQFEQMKPIASDAELEEALTLQQQIPGAAETAAAAMDATIISSDPISAIEDPDDDDDLSFDLDDLDAETDASLDLADDIDLEDAEELDLDLDLGDAAATGDGDDDELSLDDSLDLDLDADDSEAREQETVILGDGDLDLDGDLEDDDLDLDDLDDLVAAEADDDDALALDLDEDDDIDLTLDDSDSLDLDDDDDDELALSLDDDDEDDALDLDLDDGDDTLEIDLEAADDDLDLTDSPDDALELSLDDDDDALELNLDDDDDDFDLSASLDTDDDDLSLDDDDDALELNLDTEDDDDLDLDLDAVDTEDDDDLDLSADDDGLVLDMDAEDDELDLDVEEDAGTKLDLARAYIDMGDTEGARGLLQEVVADGADDDVAAANELLSSLDD